MELTMISSKSTENTRICTSALRLIAARGWGKTTLAIVAKGAKIPEASFKKRFASMNDVIPVIAAEIDREAIAACGIISGAPHDRLFDLLMARFDILQLNRKAIETMAEAARRDGALSCALARAAMASAWRLTDAAHLDAPPPRPVIAAGLIAVYAYAFFAWRRDESRDMAKTMAALDRALRWAGKAAELLTPR